MLAWSFSARTLDEVAALLRSMGRHRYVRETDHALQWSVDEALSFREPFAARAAAFRAKRASHPDLDVTSRDPLLWQYADTEVVIDALSVFWTKSEEGDRARANLRRILEESEIGLASHEPFRSDPEEPPHPELVLLDWEFFSIDELDAERHSGALRSLEMAAEEVDVSAPALQEATCIAYPELVRGAPQGVLPTDFLVWSDGAYSYIDYVFRGVAKAAHLVDPPVGIRDLE
jgi:hypothetical protein